MKVSVTGIVMTALVAVACLFSGDGGTKATTTSSAVEITNGRVFGAGVYIGNDMVVTARHITHDIKGTMIVIDTLGERAIAKTVWRSPTTDVAIIKLRSPLHIAAAQLDRRAPHNGEPIEVVGTPLGRPFVHTAGRVLGSGFEYPPEWHDAIQISAAVKPGDSGGPAYDRDGKVLGIVVGALLDAGTREPLVSIMISAREVKVVK